MVSFERLFEVLDLEPMIKESPDARRHPRRARPSCASTTSTSRTPAPTRSRWPRSRRSRRLDDTPRTAGAARRLVRVAPGHDDRPRRARAAPARRRSRCWCRASTTSTAGAVTINGVDVRDATDASLNATVGVVTQDPHLFHDTLRANLALRASPTRPTSEIEAALRAAQICAARRSRCRSDSRRWWASAGYRLAGGEKQRVALARLLLKAPRLVVLDEATAHLDAESEAAVQRALDETMASRTSLVIAHRLSTIRNADQILVVDDGRIVQRGTHAELLGAGRALPRPLRDPVRDPGALSPSRERRRRRG